MFFPLMLVLMVFIRKLIGYIFTEEELFYLDDIMPDFHIPREKDHVDDEDEKGTKSRKQSAAVPVTPNKNDGDDGDLQESQALVEQK